MGYSKSLFIDDVNGEFLCTICMDVFQDPLMLAECEHVYCTDCINTWTEVEDTCPQDRVKITKKNSLKRPQRAFLNLLDQLRRKCTFAKFGCVDVFYLGDTKAHERKCEANPEFKKECASECGAMLTKKEILTHSCNRFLKQKIQSLEALIYQTPMGDAEENEIVKVGKESMDLILAKIKDHNAVPESKIMQIQERVARDLSDSIGGTWTCDVKRGYNPFPTKSFRSPVSVEFYHNFYRVKVARVSLLKPKRFAKQN